ncbi:CRISPR-associated protein Cas2 [Thermosinus carboxydivorans Nor1]|uniref:CRISPR-associated endoribonuclease Cas2 n=1 Tax=Thermosinus carboxydivorans Nor1 TaxID=401526 RepID=A1HM65_9FIRM|nr:CRISPR-associated endonuclease Cas2 [Thermosinus carboxydivorans]EAX48914.1 CRISPR-associated protein Cas2 [Thermosinus carboxydivorans Nor1]
MEKNWLELDDESLPAAMALPQKYFVLVIYDIVCNKRRRRMVKLLEAFGFRVQKSAFECQLERRRYDRLVKIAPRLIDKTEDSLRIYLLSGKMSVLSWGREEFVDDNGTIII